MIGEETDTFAYSVHYRPLANHPKSHFRVKGQINQNKTNKLNKINKLILSQNNNRKNTLLLKLKLQEKSNNRIIHVIQSFQCRVHL